MKQKKRLAKGARRNLCYRCLQAERRSEQEYAKRYEQILNDPLHISHPLGARGGYPVRIHPIEGEQYWSLGAQAWRTVGPGGMWGLKTSGAKLASWEDTWAEDEDEGFNARWQTQHVTPSPLT